MVQAVVVESSEAPERTYPYPPRFWWLPRLSALFVVIVIAVVVARWCWGAVAHTRVTAVIDAARARGEPIVAADYPANPPPPGDDNAASYLRRAGTTIKFSRTQEWAVEYATHTALSQEMGAVIDALVAASAKELADVRTAGRFDKADWAIPMSRPMWTTLLHDLPRQRNLFLLTRAAALRAAQREDHAAALDYVRDGRVIARAVSAQPYHVSQNMATRTNARVLAALSEIVPDVRIADRSPASTAPATRAVSREQVQTLIAELLADEELRARGMRSGIHGDRAMHLDAAEHIATKSLIAKPAMRLDGLRLVGLDNGAVAAAIGPDWPTARALLPRLAATPPPPRGMVRMVSDSFKPKWDELLLEHYRVTAHARLAATALAIRLYQHDHAGQRPPTLEALVPRYLPVVPRDPFATGNQPIRYLADAQRPYLYSVGENGIDDTATGWRAAAGEMKPLEAADAIVNLFREQDVSYIFPDAPETKPSK